jgi:hypothetical protein
MTQFDEARLTAFADGEMEPEDAARMVMHLADRPEEQGYVDRLLALNEILARAYEAPMREPVPDRLRKAIMGQSAAPGEPGEPGENDRRNRSAPMRLNLGGRARQLMISGGALAAAVVAGVFLAISPEENGPLKTGFVPARTAEAESLSTIPSGGSRLIGNDEEIFLLASFRTNDKGVCREFEVIRNGGTVHRHGIACPADGGWHVEASTRIAAEIHHDAIVPASGDTVDEVGDWLDAAGAGSVLTAEEEEAARGNSWR